MRHLDDPGATRAMTAMTALLETRTRGDQLFVGLEVVNQTLGRTLTSKEADSYVRLLMGLSAQRRIGGADLPRLGELVRKDAIIHKALQRAMVTQGLKTIARTAIIGATLGLMYFGVPALEAQLAQDLLTGNDRLVVPCFGALMGSYFGAMGLGWLADDSLATMDRLAAVKKLLAPRSAAPDPTRVAQGGGPAL